MHIEDKVLPAHDASDGVTRVIYESKDESTSKTFDALDWLFQLVIHIRNKGEEMVCYYGYYSNKPRGLRKKYGTDNQVPASIDSDTCANNAKLYFASIQ
ncbi:MAG TPA: hypothetical protein ENI07_12270 [Desulfobacterales bacterium]|nr:hypothetical protein [Desulfobacterales bacterium]